MNRVRIRCYKCQEYDHFAKDCQMIKEERETEQIQQLFNLDEEQTSLKTLATDMYDSLSKINSHSFNLYYIKGKDMILSDFLSRQKHNDSDPHEIIPLSFNMYGIFYKKNIII